MKGGRLENVNDLEESAMMIRATAAIAVAMASFVGIPAHAGEEPLAVGECRRLATTELLCRAGTDWYAIVDLDHSVTVSVATE